MKWENKNIERGNLQYRAHLDTEISMTLVYDKKKISKNILFTTHLMELSECHITSGQKLLKPKNQPVFQLLVIQKFQ